MSVLDVLSDKEKEHLKKKKQPSKISSPMLATLTHDHFSDPAWIYERKLDGERVIAFFDGKNVTLKSRNNKRLNKTYPELVDAIEKQKTADFIADGEVVTFEGDITSFSRLQQRMHLSDPEEIKNSNVAVYYYLFDVLYADGYDLTNLPLKARKKVLKKLLDFNHRIRFMAHRNEKGEKYHAEACRKGWEGIIAKKGDSTYVQSRSKNWLKFKCVRQQEFVIGGWTDPKGSRIGFGALLIGFYRNGKLVYAGEVGTGYDDETLERMSKRLKKIEIDDSPFDKGDTPAKEVHWVEPRLVGEVGFTEWTSEDKLRHPRFLGLRRDKKPENVHKEA